MGKLYVTYFGKKDGDERGLVVPVKNLAPVHPLYLCALVSHKIRLFLRRYWFKLVRTLILKEK